MSAAIEFFKGLLFIRPKKMKSTRRPKKSVSPSYLENQKLISEMEEKRLRVQHLIGSKYIL